MKEYYMWISGTLLYDIYALLIPEKWRWDNETEQMHLDKSCNARVSSGERKISYISKADKNTHLISSAGLSKLLKKESLHYCLPFLK